MPRDLEEARPAILCSEAEQAVVALRVMEEAHPWLRSMTYDPLAGAAALAAASAEMRDLEGLRGMHENFLMATREEALELATSYFAAQAAARTSLRSLANLNPGLLAEIALAHAATYDLKNVRVRGSLDQARRVVADLEGRASALRATSFGSNLYDAALEWKAKLEEVFQRRLTYEHEERIAAQTVRAARARLIKLLHQMRSTWAAAGAMSNDTIYVYTCDLVKADAGRRRHAREVAAARAAAKAAALETSAEDEAPSPSEPACAEPAEPSAC